MYETVRPGSARQRSTPQRVRDMKAHTPSTN